MDQGKDLIGIDVAKTGNDFSRCVIMKRDENGNLRIVQPKEEIIELEAEEVDSSAIDDLRLHWQNFLLSDEYKKGEKIVPPQTIQIKPKMKNVSWDELEQIQNQMDEDDE